MAAVLLSMSNIVKPALRPTSALAFNSRSAHHPTSTFVDQRISTVRLLSSKDPRLRTETTIKESFRVLKLSQKIHHQFPPLHPNFQLRSVNLPPLSSSLSPDDTSSNDEERISVSGPIYTDPSPDAPTIKLFTKHGCTLCDKVKDTLSSLRSSHPELPHNLYAVDITDEDKTEWFEKYKYDIPVLHMNDVYWTKHRLAVEEAVEGLQEVTQGGVFKERQGEPDAGRLERQ